MDGAVGGETGEVVVGLADGSGVLDVVEAPVEAEDGVVLDEGVIERGVGTVPLVKPTTTMRPSKATHLVGPGEGVAADGVVRRRSPRGRRSPL